MSPNSISSTGRRIRRPRTTRPLCLSGRWMLGSAPRRACARGILGFHYWGLMIMKLITTITMLLLLASQANSKEVCDIVNGAVLIAQDDKNTYLGKIASQYDRDSIFNEYGAYGNEYSSTSIWNEYSTFGSEHSSYSPHNPYARKPPVIIKRGKILGYLGTNKSINYSISPNFLKALCEEEL
jgi:hypothetical protein